MKKHEKLPNDKILIQMLLEKRSIKKVLYELGREYTGCSRLSKLVKANNIKLDTKRGHYKERAIAERVITPYNTLDIYQIGQTISLNGHKWVIEAVTGTRRKLYHCKNEIGLKESFDALQIKGV